MGCTYHCPPQQESIQMGLSILWTRKCYLAKAVCSRGFGNHRNPSYTIGWSMVCMPDRHSLTPPENGALLWFPILAPKRALSLFSNILSSALCFVHLIRIPQREITRNEKLRGVQNKMPEWLGLSILQPSVATLNESPHLLFLAPLIPLIGRLGETEPSLMGQPKLVTVALNSLII